MRWPAYSCNKADAGGAGGGGLDNSTYGRGQAEPGPLLDLLGGEVGSVQDHGGVSLPESGGDGQVDLGGVGDA